MTPAMHFERYRLHLTFLSPVHIGSGQEIEPFEYILLNRPNGQFLVAVDLPKLLKSLAADQKKEFNTLLNRNDFVQIRQWLQKQADPLRHAAYTVQVQDDAFKELSKNEKNPDRLGRIELFTRHANTGKSFLPGSSLKGAIRTAVIDNWIRTAQSKHAFDRERNNNKLEALVMGNSREGRPNLYADPFRQLAISDASLKEGDTYIDQIKIVRAVPPDPQRDTRKQSESILMYRELTWSALDDEDLSIQTECRLYSRLPDQSIRQKSGEVTPAVSKPMTIETVVQSCNKYYQPRLIAEIKQFKAIMNDNAGVLESCTSDLQESECLIRVGRHSHFECVTFSDPYRNAPKRGFGKSRSYAGGELPLGWIKLKFTPIER